MRRREKTAAPRRGISDQVNTNRATDVSFRGAKVARDASRERKTAMDNCGFRP